MLTLYANPRSYTCQNLGVFHKNKKQVFFFLFFFFFLTLKTHGLFACQNLGVFKEYKDFGLSLTPYQNPRFNACQNLGVFRNKNHVFRHKTPKASWLVKILGFSTSANTLGLHCIKIPGLTHVKILGYLLRRRFFWHPKPVACMAFQNS